MRHQTTTQWVAQCGGAMWLGAACQPDTSLDTAGRGPCPCHSFILVSSNGHRASREVHSDGGGGFIRREGTSKAAPQAVRQAVGGGSRSGCGRLLSVTNAIEAGTWRQGDRAGRRLGALGGGGVTPTPSNASGGGGGAGIFSPGLTSEGDISQSFRLPKGGGGAPVALSTS